jgi:autotransporter-associated beta strand protein
MSIITWNPTDNNYTTGTNWTGNSVPGFSDTAVFGESSETNVAMGGAFTTTDVGEWVFDPTAPAYTFTISQTSSKFHFVGTGIIGNGVSVTITVSGFHGGLVFDNGSSAGTANIEIKSVTSVDFLGFSTGGNAIIHGEGGGLVIFDEHSTGGNAQLIDAGTIEFLGSGPAGNGEVTIGSIVGGGLLLLDADQLTVGGNGMSTSFGGVITDNGMGGSLVKVGHDSLTLSGLDNTYAGGTKLELGTLNLAAVDAAGTGAIVFAHGSHATLKLENAALSGHTFENAIDFFAGHDVVDLSGLKFHAGAEATYHKATHRLAVHSGHVTDALTMISPHGTHFAAASDGHGGTEVLLLLA